MAGRTVRAELTSMCMIEHEDGKRVLVLDKVGSWRGITFPGGHVEAGESATAATIREVKEETGLDVSHLTPCGLINWCHRETGARYLVFLFKTRCYAGTLVEATDEGKVYWIDRAALENVKLAPNMETYLRLFLQAEAHEAFATWDARENGAFTLYGSVHV